MGQGLRQHFCIHIHILGAREGADGLATHSQIFQKKILSFLPVSLKLSQNNEKRRVVLSVMQESIPDLFVEFFHFRASLFVVSL